MGQQPADARPTASVYIDGLNLYRRLLAGRPDLKWLDIEVLAEHLLPEYDIVRVRYFTAVIKALPGADATSPQRQQAYLRTLRSLPRTSVELGKFRDRPASDARASDGVGGRREPAPSASEEDRGEGI